MTGRRQEEELLLLRELFERRQRLEGGLPEDGPPLSLEQTASTRIEVVGEEVLLSAPEGRRYTLPLATLLEQLEPLLPPPPALVWPQGTRAVRVVGDALVVAHETQPTVHRLQWASGEAPPRSRRKAVYREVRLALPYVVLVTALRIGDRPRFLGTTQVYFSSRALTSAQEPLHHAPLLNVLRTESGSQVCLNGISSPDLAGERDPSRRLHRMLAAVFSHLLYSGFNEDLERTGRRSSFHDPETKPADPRLATIEAWEAATAADPTFVLDIPWIPAGRTLEHTLNELAVEAGILRPGTVRNGTLQRLIINHGQRVPDEVPS